MAGLEVERLDRKEFLAEYWDYRPGQHVTILAPTGWGKTYLAHELLAATMTPECPAVILAMKPRDATVTSFARKLKLRTVRVWPPPSSDRWLRRRPRGWLLWPRHTHDPEVDDARHEVIFRRAILDNYKRGNRITFADETYSLEHELDLRKPLNTVWTKGRSMDNGLWAASQRPAYISRWAYQAHHLFLGDDPDARQRLGEIGAAVDRDAVLRALASLAPGEYVYINREDRTICTISR